jgi:alkaline phosphatase
MGKTVSFLQQKGNGFFLMIEGSKIDWAGHSRDGATNFREIKDLEESVKLAYDFYRKYPDETLIIVTADHETGGVVLGNGNYSLNLQALQYQTMSGIAFTKEIENLRKQNTEISWETIQKALSHAFGFWSKLDLSPEQEAHLKKIYEETIHNQQGDLIKSLYENNEPIAEAAKTILNEIAEITWSCSSHTAGYVPLYAIGLGAENFQGKLDNTDVPLLIARIAGYE